MSKRPQLFPEASPAQRLELLKDNASAVSENYPYTKELSAEDLKEMREQYSDESIQLAEVQEEFEIIKEDFKGRMKPFKLRLNELLGHIKNKFMTTKGTVFFMPDQVEGKMFIYNAEGICVEERDLRPEEMQMNIRQLKQSN